MHPIYVYLLIVVLGGIAMAIESVEMGIAVVILAIVSLIIYGFRNMRDEEEKPKKGRKK